MTSLAQLERTLREADEPYALLPLQGDAVALLTQRGGRVLGLFPTRDAENLLWVYEEAYASGEAFRAYVATGTWNIGGERIWIAPELQYNVHDRARFWETMRVPAGMDPGRYTLAVKADAPVPTARLHATMPLQAYNLGSGQQTLAVERLLAPVPDPLAHTAQRPDGVAYAGYQQQVRLRAHNRALPAAGWLLAQVNAGGQAIIPCTPRIQASDYFGRLPAEASEVRTSSGDLPHIRLDFDHTRQYKVGYGAAGMLGRFGYWRVLDGGRAELLVRAFFSNPSNPYLEEPPPEPGVRGHAVHLYNDGGHSGGVRSFGELECSGTTLDANSALLDDTAQDTYLLWTYTGAAEAVRQAAWLLLGVRP